MVSKLAEPDISNVVSDALANLVICCIAQVFVLCISNMNMTRFCSMTAWLSEQLWGLSLCCAFGNAMLECSEQSVYMCASTTDVRICATNPHWHEQISRSCEVRSRYRDNLPCCCRLCLSSTDSQHGQSLDSRAKTPPNMPSLSRDLNRPLKNILVLSATGNIGLPIVQALAAHRTAAYSITATTRNASSVPPTYFPPGVSIVSSDLSPTSLRPLFLQADAVVSCVHVPYLPKQMELIDLAISCGVARFMPSEFGVNTTHPDAPRVMPLIQAKIDTQKFLAEKAAEGEIQYTTVYNGSFFDWFFRFPDAMGFDVPTARATVYDGGDVPYEVTTVEKIGEAVAAALSPENKGETRNQRVFVNSFTLTQNRLLPVLEKVTGRRWTVLEDSIVGLKERIGKENGWFHGGERAIAAELLTACLRGEEGMNLFSRDERVGGLWNERLGLREEGLEEAVREVVRAGKKTGVIGGRN